MGVRVAYGDKSKINIAINDGTIPKECIVIANNNTQSIELFFYNIDGVLKEITYKNKFSSFDEATNWVEQWDCIGNIISIYDKNGWIAYIVQNDKTLLPIGGTGGGDNTVIVNRISAIEADYLKSSDKLELSQEIADAKEDVTKRILGENSDLKFDTLKEVSDWILADTANSTTLISRISSLESQTHQHENKTIIDMLTHDKISQWDNAQSNIIDAIQINNKDVDILNKKAILPLATEYAFGVTKADGTSICSTDGIFSVKSVNINHLFIDDDTELVLSGGIA